MIQRLARVVCVGSSVVVVAFVGACAGDTNGSSPMASRCDSGDCDSGASPGGAASGGAASGGHGGAASGGAAGALGSGGAHDAGFDGAAPSGIGFVACGGLTNPVPTSPCDLSKSEACCGYRSAGSGFTVYTCHAPSATSCESLTSCDEDADCPSGQTCASLVTGPPIWVRGCSGAVVPPVDASIPLDAPASVPPDAAASAASDAH